MESWEGDPKHYSTIFKTSDFKFFWCRKFTILILQKVPSNMVKGPFQQKEIQEKITQFQEGKVLKSPRFGQIFSFLLLKLPYLSNRF
jgi:hypothetical protein